LRAFFTGLAAGLALAAWIFAHRFLAAAEIFARPAALPEPGVSARRQGQIIGFGTSPSPTSTFCDTL
jgi:hypothetical protein